MKEFFHIRIQLTKWQSELTTLFLRHCHYIPEKRQMVSEFQTSNQERIGCCSPPFAQVHIIQKLSCAIVLHVLEIR